MMKSLLLAVGLSLSAGGAQVSNEEAINHLSKALLLTAAQSLTEDGKDADSVSGPIIAGGFVLAIEKLDSAPETKAITRTIKAMLAKEATP